MTIEEAIKYAEAMKAKIQEKLGRFGNTHAPEVYYSDLAFLSAAISALREQEERESVWHNAKDSPPKKPGLYYGKKDDTDSMFLCQYRDGVWTMDAYPETRMHVIKWAYYNVFVQDQEQWRWIPVAERLPENIGLYLVIEKHWLDGSQCIKIAKWNAVDWFTADRKSKEITPRVTHWMPIPHPQKGE